MGIATLLASLHVGDFEKVLGAGVWYPDGLVCSLGCSDMSQAVGAFFFVWFEVYHI